jgi:kynurenine formamidase
MKMSFGDFIFDSESGVSIAIPLDFNGRQVNAWGVDRASAVATEAGDLIGDTRRGGSCNFETYTLIPHCNGTHTECVGHLTLERISVADCLKETMMAAVLVTVEPTPADSAHEALTEAARPTDLVITASSVRHAISRQDIADCSAIVVRTLPNDEAKMGRTHDDDSTPYFSKDCIELFVELGIKHLVCDIPSVDRMHDGGVLINHRLFWGVEGRDDLADDIAKKKTITELAYIPDSLADGIYILDLQIPHFVADAAPSRPILFPTE